MSDINKYTTKEVLNKVLLDSSGNAVNAYSHTSQEAFNAALDDANSRLNVNLVGGTIGGDVTINGDLTVNGDGAGAYDEIVNGDLHIKSDSGNSTNAFLVEKNDGTDVFIVDTTNSRIGINSTPSRTFQVDGTASATTATGYFYTNAIHTGVDTQSVVSIRSDNASSNGNVLHVQGDGTGNLLTLSKDGSDKLTVTHEGNVGIGTTSPTAKLTVSGSMDDNIIKFGAVPAQNIAFGVTNDRDATRVDFFLATEYGTESWTKRLTVTNQGKVGIGTTSPSGILSIFRNDSSTVGTNDVVIENDGSGDASLKFSLTGATDWYAYVDNSDSDKFKIRRSTTDHFSIDESGNATFAGDITTNERLIFGGTNDSIVASAITPHSNGFIYIAGGSGGLVIGDDATSSRIQIMNDAEIKFEVNGSEKMRIEDSGNINIGSSSSKTNNIGSSARGITIANAIAPVLSLWDTTNAGYHSHFFQVENNATLRSSGNLIFQTNAANTALTIDSSQNSTFAGNVQVKNSGFVFSAGAITIQSGSSTNVVLDAGAGADEFTLSDSALNITVPTTFGGNVTSNGNILSQGASAPSISVLDTTNNASIQMRALDTEVRFGSTSNHPVKIGTNNTYDALILGTDKSATFGGDITVSSATDTKPILKLEQTGNNVNGGQFIFLTSGTANDNDLSGVIRFKGMNDAGTPEEIEYATIYAKNTDVSDGSEDGELHFRTMSAGSLDSRLTLSSSNATFSGSINTQDITAYNMITIESADISNGENNGLRLINTSGTDHYWHITNGQTGVSNENFTIRDGTNNRDIVVLETSSGNATFYNRIILGGGITFPASQNASSNANTLDDYEEGDYAGAIGCGSSGSVTIDSSVNNLQYTKIGRVVHVIGQLNVSSVSSPSGFFVVTVPFAIGDLSESGGRTSGSITVTGVTSANVSDFIVLGVEGETSMRVYLGDGTSPVADSANQLQAGATVRVNFTYYV